MGEGLILVNTFFYWFETDRKLDGEIDISKRIIIYNPMYGLVATYAA